jgi:hypothetical protein
MVLWLLQTEIRMPSFSVEEGLCGSGHSPAMWGAYRVEALDQGEVAVA